MRDCLSHLSLQVHNANAEGGVGAPPPSWLNAQPGRVPVDPPGSWKAAGPAGSCVVNYTMTWHTVTTHAILDTI